MIAAVYDAMVEEFARGALDWENGEIKVMLATGDYEPDQANDRTRADVVAAEPDPSGTYVRGGMVLRGRSIAADTPGATRLMGAPVSWAHFTGRFRYAVVYQANGAPGRDGLVAFTDLGDQTVTDARVELEFDSTSGVCEFAVVPAI